MKIKTEERADYGPAKEKRVAVQWQRLEIVKVAGAPAMPPPEAPKRPTTFTKN